METVESAELLASKRNVLRTRRVNVDQKVAQMLYEDMVLGRQFEDMIAQMYYKGRVAGFVHLYNGQEAVSTGVIKCLRPDDYVSSTYRDHVHALSKGMSAREVMAELYGKETGCCKGRGGSMHMFSAEHNFVGGFAFISENIPIALGTAFASAYKRDSMGTAKDMSVTCCFLGDGASNNGILYECFNMASLMKLPIVFVVENNSWAIGMSHIRSTAVPEIYKRGPPFGVPSVEVDGMDVLAVRAVAREAVKKAREGRGPTLIEALTYRFRGHSLADPDELRAPLEKGAWLARDPIERFGEYMKKRGFASDYTLKLAKKKIREIVNDSVKFAESSPEPKPEDVGKYVMTDDFQAGQPENLSSEDLRKYAEALAEELNTKERRKAGEKVPPPRVELSRDPMKVIE